MLIPPETTLHVVSGVMSNAHTDGFIRVILSFSSELDGCWFIDVLDILYADGKQVYFSALYSFNPDHFLSMHYNATRSLMLNRLRASRKTQ
ncbi:MAG: hypothetical protein ACTXOO_00515 [Sodalis sp. (in: enterobacteria)]